MVSSNLWQPNVSTAWIHLAMANICAVFLPVAGIRKGAMIDDVDLLRRYVENGSEEAFTELVQRHIDFVYSAALRMTKSTHRAEDVTQNVFTDLCRKAKKLLGRRNLAGWLYLSARYASTMLIRRECRRELREHKAHLLSEQSSESARAIDWKQLAPVLDDVLGKLPTPDRDAILLRFFKNASFAEIGAALQLSENGARMRVNRAIEKTRNLLARRGISSTAVAFELAVSAQPAVAAPAAFASSVSGTAMVAATSGATAVWSTATFALWKILTGVAIAALGTGLVVYEAKHIHSPAGTSGPTSQISSAGQNPINRTEQAVSGPSQTVDNSNTIQPQPSPANANVEPGLGLAVFRHKMKTDAEYRASIIALAKSRLDLFYRPLFTTLDLPEARFDQFKDLLIEQQLVGIGVGEAMQTTGVRQEGTPPADLNKIFYQSMYDAQRSLDDEIKAFLTPPEYAQYLDYSEVLMPWIAVNALARSLRSTATPLADEQASDRTHFFEPPVASVWAVI